MKSALVTGGSRGIGKAVCLRLARDGFHVVINYKSNTFEARNTLDEITGMGKTGELLPFDVNDRHAASLALQGLMDKKSIDVLVHCAGIRNDELFVFMNEEHWDEVLDTNLKSFFTIVKPVAKQMLLAHQGRIIILSSTSGQTGLPGQVHYSAAKAGLIGAVKALAQECAKRNVLVNAVAPGFIATDMTGEIDQARIKAQVPMQRIGSAAEVASVVSFLASPDSSYMTGQVLSVNGGIYM